jgi:hypothetical protein
MQLNYDVHYVKLLKSPFKIEYAFLVRCEPKVDIMDHTCTVVTTMKMKRISHHIHVKSTRKSKGKDMSETKMPSSKLNYTPLFKRKRLHLLDRDAL